MINSTLIRVTYSFLAPPGHVVGSSRHQYLARLTDMKKKGALDKEEPFFFWRVAQDLEPKESEEKPC